jgi:hypothetical protein
MTTDVKTLLFGIQHVAAQCYSEIWQIIEHGLVRCRRTIDLAPMMIMMILGFAGVGYMTSPPQDRDACRLIK